MWATDRAEASVMTEEQSRYQAEALVAVRVPPGDCEILATIEPPSGMIIR
jgi:hypothetical protein